jgi:hypothetical protein
VTGEGGVVAASPPGDFASLADGRTEGVTGALGAGLDDVGPGDGTTGGNRVEAVAAGASLMIPGAVPVPATGWVPQAARATIVAATTPAV